MAVKKLDVLLETDHYVVVNKPAGLATIPGRGETNSVLQELARQLSLPCSGTGDPRLRVVHRLDKDTSGVLLFAKDVDTQRHLSHQFQNNTIEKQYLAIVAGHPQSKSGEINAPMGPHPTAKDRMTTLKHGRPARTLWELEQKFRQYALLRVFPKTGKTHQIRVHLKSIGLPLAVDPLYNPPAHNSPDGLFLSQFKRDYRPTRGEEERPLIGRLTLHAHRLKFTTPQGETITAEAPVPKDFRATVNQLSRHG